jgi:hypothetical protein
VGFDLPPDVPVPLPRPDAVQVEPDVAGDGEPDAASPDRARDEVDATDPANERVADPPPAIETEDSAPLAACLAELRSIGATFSEKPRIDDGAGCGIDRPIVVSTIGNGVALVPPATLRCRTAVNLARWTRDVVAPMLDKARPGERLAAIDQASAYVCRKRNGADTGKISEHAHGTAIDIAGFTLQSGKTFAITPREEEPTLNGAFQRAIATAACLYFTTVLDPGSDKAHEMHLHLDTIARKAGYRYCW